MANKKFRVNEAKRIVRAYNEDIVSKEDFEMVERYTKLGYKVILIPNKPKTYRHIKNDMITYLEGKIDNKIYKEFIDRVEMQQNFLELKWWLAGELKTDNENKKQAFERIEGIINQAKSKENGVIEKAKEQARMNNKSKNDNTSNENKSKENEN